MSKGSYNVYNPVPTNSKSDDTFWKTFLCSSLVLLVIVLIFLLIALPIKRDLEGIKENIYNAPERRYNSFRKVHSTTPESSQNYDQMSDYDYDSTDPKHVKETVTQKLKDEVEDVDSTFTQVIEKVTKKNMKLMFRGFTPTENIDHHTETEADVEKSSTVYQDIIVWEKNDKGPH